LKSHRQSPFPASSIQSFRFFSRWPTDGRTAPTRGHAVAAVRRLRSHPSGHQAFKVATTTDSALTRTTTPSLFRSLLHRVERLSTAPASTLASSCALSTTLPPPKTRPQLRLEAATSPSTPRSQSRFGRVTFSFSTAAVPRRSSSARRLSVARGLWASLSPTCRCVRVEVEWGCSSRVRVGTSGSLAARFRHHHTGGPPCPTASTFPWLCRPVLATNRLSSMTWSCLSAQLRRSAHRRRAPATAAPPLCLSLLGGAIWPVARACGREL
jgi:hypothetical protein